MLFQTEFPLQRGNACQNAVLKNHAQPRHSPGGKEHHQAHVPASLGELAARKAKVEQAVAGANLEILSISLERQNDIGGEIQESQLMLSEVTERIVVNFPHLNTNRGIERRLDAKYGDTNLRISGFVTTDECDADPAFKQSYIEAHEEDIEIIQSPVGMPGRAIRNSFLDRVKEGLKVPKACPFDCIKTCDVTHSPYCIMLALYNAFKGKLQNGYAFCGANAWRAEKIQSVRDLMASLKAEYDNFSLKGKLFGVK